MKSIAHLIIARWWICVVLAAGCSILAVVGLTSQRAGSEMGEVKSAYALKSQLDGEFGSDGGDCLIVVDVAEMDGDLFTAGRLEGVRQIEQQLERLEMVENALWLGDVMLRSGEGDGEDLAGMREQALGHPLARRMLSEDARTLVMPVMFTREAMDDENYAKKVSAVRAAVEGRDGPAGLRVRLTGLFFLWEAEQVAVNRDRLKFIVIGYVLTSLLAIYLFRSLWVTAAIGLPAFIGVFWTIGILAFFHERPTPLTQVVMPMMLTMVGFSDAVHLMFHIRRARWAGETRVEAAISAVRDLGVPCALTSLTTAVGFGSLMIADAAVIQSFGKSCAIGVVVTFLAVVTLVPLLSLTRLGKNVHLSHEHDFMEKRRAGAERLVGFILAKARWVVVGSALLMIVFALAASTLRPDTRFLSRLPDSSESFQAMQHVDTELGGTQMLRVSLEWDDGSLDAAAQVAKLGEVEAVLAEEELIGEPLSLLTLLESLPKTGDDLAARMGMLGLVPERLVGGFYRPDVNRAVVSARVQDLGIANYKPVFERVDVALEELEIPGLRIEMTGDPIIWGRYLDGMVTDLLKSLGLASAIILVVMGLVYRSVRIGLIAIVPNLFPLAATGAMLAFFKIPMVIETVCAFTICLGIAVDDTIHFLSRYRRECERHGLDGAIRESFVKVGSPLVVTTVLMVTGFATVLWSELPGFRMFGAMACVTLAAAFVADLLILPALLKVFGRRPG